MTFTILDLIFVAIIILCIVMGLVKGFIDSVFDKAAPLVAVFGAFLFCRRLALYLSPYIKNSVVAIALSFIGLFIVLFIVVKIIQVIIGKLFDNEILDGLNRTLGFAFGLIESLALICIIIWVLKKFPFFDFNPYLENSLFFRLYQNILIPASQVVGGTGTNV